MLRYDISPLDPEAHLFIIGITVSDPTPNEQFLRLPAWISGSYLVRDFAGNVQNERADIAGRPVPMDKVDKSTWRIPTKGIKDGEVLHVFYEVWAFDNSVRTAYLDECRGFFNPGCVFMEVLGIKPEKKISVMIRQPEDQTRAEQSDWSVATALKRAKGTERFGWGLYEASDYDELIDSPVELGTFTAVTFKANGTRHDVVFSDTPVNFDIEKTMEDMRAICEHEIAFWDPESKKAPMREYVFLVNVTSASYGGLEHRASTALQIPTRCLPSVHDKSRTEDYVQFLGLVAHEYFHTWNVKRIKPAEFTDIDFSTEIPTELLWFFEGFTSYYDDLIVRRCGLTDNDGYAKLLTSVVRSVLETNAQTVQTLAQASFDTWIKFYKPSANTANANVSYYRQGALAAWVIDAAIRAESKGAASLDDVMRALWQQFCEAGKDYAGLTEETFLETVAETTGCDLTDLIGKLIHTTERPDYQKLLKPLGVTFEETKTDTVRSLLGLSGIGSEAGFTVKNVYDKEAAQWAGISAGDVLIALDGVRIKNNNLEKLLTRYGEGDEMVVHAFRDDALMVWALLLGHSQPCRSTVSLKKPTALGKKWLEA